MGEQPCDGERWVRLVQPLLRREQPAELDDIDILESLDDGECVEVVLFERVLHLVVVEKLDVWSGTYGGEMVTCHRLQIVQWHRRTQRQRHLKG